MGKNEKRNCNRLNSFNQYTATGCWSNFHMNIETISLSPHDSDDFFPGIFADNRRKRKKVSSRLAPLTYEKVLPFSCFCFHFSALPFVVRSDAPATTLIITVEGWNKSFHSPLDSFICALWFERNIFGKKKSDGTWWWSNVKLSKQSRRH